MIRKRKDKLNNILISNITSVTVSSNANSSQEARVNDANNISFTLDQQFSLNSKQSLSQFTFSSLVRQRQATLRQSMSDLGQQLLSTSADG